MNDINKIKKQLDEIYSEYKSKNNKLSDGNSNTVVQLLMVMSNNTNAQEKDIARELSRFTSYICMRYFTNLTKSTSSNIDIIDGVINAMLSFDTDKTKSAIYAKKYSFIISAVINNSNTSIFKSKMLPKLVMIIVKSTNTNNQKQDFEVLIKKTDGNIYKMDYSSFEHSALFDFYQLTKDIYPDMAKCKYANEISEWATKYDFSMNSQENKIIEDKTIVKSSTNEKSEKSNDIVETIVTYSTEAIKVNEDKTSSVDSTSDKSSEITKEDTSNSEKENGVNSDNNSVAVKFDNSEVLSLVSGEGKKTRELISKELISLQNTVNSFKADLSKSMEVANTNAMLQRKIEKLESELETVKQVNDTQRIALEQLTKEKSEIEIKALEFEEQLKKAFDLDSRETENKADKVKFDILNAVKLSYENWTEYESAEYSEDNYESLKAIIKAIFRGLERNGINIKGID